MVYRNQLWARREREKGRRGEIERGRRGGGVGEYTPFHIDNCSLRKLSVIPLWHIVTSYVTSQ